MISSADFNWSPPRGLGAVGTAQSTRGGGLNPGTGRGTVKIVSDRSHGRQRSVPLAVSVQKLGRLRSGSRGRRQAAEDQHKNAPYQPARPQPAAPQTPPHPRTTDQPATAATPRYDSEKPAAAQPCTTASQQPPGKAHHRKLNRNSAAPLPIPSGKTKRHRPTRPHRMITDPTPWVSVLGGQAHTRSRRPHQRRTQVPRPPTWTRVPLVKSGGSHDPPPSQRPADVTVPPRWTGPSPSSARSTPTAEAASRTRPTRPPFWAPAVAPRAKQDDFSCRGLPIGMTRLPLPARRLLALTGTNT
jgi:hypothetical protein